MKDRMREGHAHRIDESGKIIFMEDAVMEMKLGRKLTENEEVVHHNGDTLDNRDSNLKLITIEVAQ